MMNFKLQHKLVIETVLRDGFYTINYDVGGSPDEFSENFRLDFAAELHSRLQAIDKNIPMFQNQVWNPRRRRLSLPLGEILVRKKGDTKQAIEILSKMVERWVDRSRDTDCLKEKIIL